MSISPEILAPLSSGCERREQGVSLSLSLSCRGEGAQPAQAVVQRTE
jgi:hypothetical protein